jgi:glycosyltransferase involved in cell wall biosynthesis
MPTQQASPKYPSISVVIPTYNRAEKVCRAIESALAQTVRDLEIIVVDDGSSDDTALVLKSAFGDRIRYIPQPNQGASVARNRGIEEATGEWIAFLDSDDWWEAEKIQQQMDAVRRVGTNCGACYTDVRFFNHSETRTMFELAESSYRHVGHIGVNGEAPRLLVNPGGAGMVICLSSLLARKDLICQVGPFDPDLLYSQDSEFMFRLAIATLFCFVNRPLVRFDRSPPEDRHVGVSSVWNTPEFFLQDSQLRLERLLRLTRNQPASLRNVVRGRLGAIHSGWVNCHLSSGQSGKARASAWEALRVAPSVNYVAKWLLTCMSPALALRTIRQRGTKKASAFTV